MKPISAADSGVIVILRVICIIPMMLVHVNPGPSEASFINVAPFAWISVVFVDFLGRASVTALSLVSGYLALGAIGSGRCAAFVRQRAVVLLVPMVCWNAIMLVLFCGAVLFGVESAASDRVSVASPGGLMDALLALGGQPANPALGFLRDLFVSSVLVAVLYPLWRRAPIASLVLAFGVVVADALTPVVLRPTILFFLLAGAVLRQRGVGLCDLARRDRAIPLAAASFAIAIALHHPGLAHEAADAAANLFKRAGLTAMFLMVGLHASCTVFGQVCARLEPSIYLAFLSHGVVISILWKGLGLLGADPLHPSYVVFFFAAPALAVAAAYYLRAVLSRAPEPVAVALSGKAQRRRAGWSRET